jgi:hypothetical protein
MSWRDGCPTPRSGQPTKMRSPAASAASSRSSRDPTSSSAGASTNPPRGRMVSVVAAVKRPRRFLGKGSRSVLRLGGRADRVSRVDYSPRAARGRLWASHAGLAAVAADLRARYPRRYGAFLIELAKWAALAGDGRRARAASREAIRYAPSRRSLLMAAVVLAPARFLGSAAGLRLRVSGVAVATRRRPGAER